LSGLGGKVKVAGQKSCLHPNCTQLAIDRQLKSVQSLNNSQLKCSDWLD